MDVFVVKVKQFKLSSFIYYLVSWIVRYYFVCLFFCFNITTLSFGFQRRNTSDYVTKSFTPDSWKPVETPGKFLRCPSFNKNIVIIIQAKVGIRECSYVVSKGHLRTVPYNVV